MGSFKMKLLLIAASLALAAAAPHSDERQKWRPAKGRDLSQYKSKLPEVAPGTLTPTAPHLKSFEFKKGNKSFAEECGLENPNGVEDGIVGGHEAAHHEWPWQVALFVDDAWFCGGSLISDEWVMTAAHCADGLGTLTSWRELTMSALVLSRTGWRSPPSRVKPTQIGIQAASTPTLRSSTCRRRSPSASTSGPPVSLRRQMRMRNMLDS